MLETLRLPRGPLRIALLLGALCPAAGAFPGQATAQIVPPPRQDSQSPEGVSFRSGAYSYSEQDLSIGGGLPTGLSLTRVYVSSTMPPSDLFAGTPGWAHNLLGYVSVAPMPQDPSQDPPLAGHQRYLYSVTFGGKSIGFFGSPAATYPYATGGPTGAHPPVVQTGASLVFTGASATGYYTFTDSDGTIVNFNPGTARISNWTMPDGTRLDYTYSSTTGAIKSVISNRGWAILMDGTTRACAVNMAQTYITATSTCPSGVQTVTYGYGAGTYNIYVSLLTSATKDGQTTTYSYVGADHLGCVKEPGQTACRIQTQYSYCPEDPANPYQQPQVHLSDPVATQQDGGGKTYAFSYDTDRCPVFNGDPDYRPFTGSTTTMTVNGTAQTVVVSNTASVASSVTDPLGRQTSFNYQPNDAWQEESSILGAIAYPEGNSEVYPRDARGNVTGKTLHAKPGSGLADIVSTASYPSTCTYQKTCNKPDYVIDANGNRTDYTYDTSHGGMLTETGPADAGGIHPVKRYAYAQRYAWIKNAGGTYSHAASPVWVLTEMRTCRTSATVSGTCAAGSSDEIVTGYDYGPDSGPNNLLLRGTTLTAGGQTLRTCYGYDGDGNRISQTSPRAGLTVCP